MKDSGSSWHRPTWSPMQKKWRPTCCMSIKSSNWAVIKKIMVNNCRTLCAEQNSSNGVATSKPGASE
ncbi:hypothetical protein GDO81_022581 [Engystomops pustulosus]|uniref:Uncharacterized protein n=1 Tax=Engystomops pustulosus TaxID=76066 RepID=A0AAV6YM11_ENGPU|nr:hypothetical protein GDO81_022581 [Engystomops pustulosus]